MNYWLSPSGEVWEDEEIGCHYRIAIDIIVEKYDNLLDQFLLKEDGIRMYAGHDAVTDLEKLGYIRYMDWNNPHWILYGQKPTRIQIKRMFELTKFIYDAEPAR